MDDHLEASQNEYVYGRAGYLYLLRLVSTHLPSAAKLVEDAKKQVIDVMISVGPSPLSETKNPWYFVGKPYLSVGHGWLGCIDQILHTDPSPGRAAQLRPFLLRIIDLQLESGNWRKFIDEQGVNETDLDMFVQWGHGAPGVVSGLFGLRGIYEAVGDKEMVGIIDEAVAKAQDVIWQRGNLTKASCLCHGLSGNSLALTDMERKGTFLALGTEDKIEAGLKDGSLEASSSPSGLHRGLAGTIWAMAEYARGRYGIYLSYNEL